jgi:pyoverdine/dityrosine biosynthesis protein Dit1
MECLSLPVEMEVQDIVTNTNPQTIEFPASESTNSLDDKLSLANRILDIIKSYGTNEVTDKSLPGCAKATFLPVVLANIKNGTPIRIILPAFPAKSPNRKGKVLGALPDLGEEIALQCLQGLCDNIRQIYKPGAEVSIASDGLVYNGKY